MTKQSTKYWFDSNKPLDSTQKFVKKTRSRKSRATLKSPHSLVFVSFFLSMRRWKVQLLKTLDQTFFFEERYYVISDKDAMNHHTEPLNDHITLKPLLCCTALWANVCIIPKNYYYSTLLLLVQIYKIIETC